MLICDQPSFEKYLADFSLLGAPNPVWTSVTCEKIQLCNSLEEASWGSNPVRVEQHWPFVGVASEADISRLGDFVLWTWPADPSEPGGPASAFFSFGAVAIPATTWQLFRAAAAVVPKLEDLPPSNGSYLRAAWVMGQIRQPFEDDKLMAWLRANLLAADILDNVDAIGWIEHWLHWFRERAHTPVKGSLVPISSANAEIATLYLEDSELGGEWPAIGKCGESFVPAFGSSHVFIPER